MRPILIFVFYFNNKNIKSAINVLSPFVTGTRKCLSLNREPKTPSQVICHSEKLPGHHSPHINSGGSNNDSLHRDVTDVMRDVFVLTASE